VATPQPEQHPTAGDNPRPLTAVGAGRGFASPGAVWLTTCAWCGRIRVRGRWIADDGSLAPARAARRVTHGICPSCFRAVSSQAERARLARRVLGR
jgi:hypothetical protein